MEIILCVATSSKSKETASHTHTSHLSILGASDVHQGLGSRVDYIQQFQDGGSIIGDRGLTWKSQLIIHFLGG